MIDIIEFLIRLMVVVTVIYVLRQMSIRFKTTWRKVSDTTTPAGTFRFFDGDDILQVYSRNKGRCVSFTCINHTAIAESITLTIPKDHSNPYDYIMSGDLDNEIRDLRMVAEYALLNGKDGSKYSGKRVLRRKNIHKEMLRFRPISFDDFKTLNQL